jgi:hypothetical protein
MICPICGNEAERTETKYGIRNDCCGLHSWGEHPLVDDETHELRKKAHAAFDPIWQSKRFSRTKAYRKLSYELKIQTKDCHIKTLTKDQLRLVPEVINRWE